MKIYLITKGENDLIKNIKELLISAGINDIHVVESNKITPQEVKEKASDAEILVASPTAFAFLSKEHMESMPKLKLITTLSVGTDWIDLNAARERQIIVSNEKGVNAEAVAEHCFGLVLDLTKRITESDRDIRQKENCTPADYMGINIFGRTLGIIGLGDIGKAVARIAGGFNMRVLGVNRSKTQVTGVDLVDLQKLLQESDIIVVTVPSTSETENLLSVKEFQIMKSGVFIVSISREKIINKNAILENLEQGKVSGFGFDADIIGTIPKDDPWLKNNRVVVTPHSASMTEESEKGYALMTLENVKAFLADKPIRVVN